MVSFSIITPQHTGQTRMLVLPQITLLVICLFLIADGFLLLPPPSKSSRGLGRIPTTSSRLWAAPDKATVDPLSEIRKMRALQIKQELTQRGVSTAGVVDKEDLVDLLVKARKNGPIPPTTSSTTGSSSRKSNAAARVPFRQKTPPTTLPGGGQSSPGPKSYVCIDVVVNGQRLEFLIDSGATPTIITERTRARLGLRPLGGGQRIEGVAATGAASAPRVMLNGVCLGGATGAMVTMDALVMGNEGVLPQGVDGLLGIKYLQYYGIVDFDFKRQYLTVYPYDAKTESGSTDIKDLLDDPPEGDLMIRGVPMSQDPMSGIYFVDLNLGSPSAPPVPAIVDLGAGMSMCNWLAAEQVGISRNDPSKVIKNTMKVWGVDGSTVDVDIADFGKLYMNQYIPLSGSRIGVANLPAFGLIGYGKRPVGLLGMDVFGGVNKRMIFDFRRNILYTSS